MSGSNEREALKLHQRRREFGNLLVGRAWLLPRPGRVAFLQTALEQSWDRFILDDEFASWYRPHVPTFSGFYGNHFHFEARKSVSVRKHPGGSGVSAYFPLDDLPLDATVAGIFDETIFKWFVKMAEVIDATPLPRPPFVRA